MHLRHIDPRSTDWKDAMLDEAKRDEEGLEAEPEMEAAASTGTHRASPTHDRRTPGPGLSAPSR
jgi:hypothetical protein